MSKGPPSTTLSHTSTSSKRKKSEKSKGNNRHRFMGELLILSFLTKFPMPSEANGIETEIVNKYFGVLMGYGGLLEYLREQEHRYATTLVQSQILPLYQSSVCLPFLIAPANSDDEKHSHLHKLQRESDEKLKPFKADLLDYDSLIPAVQGCAGVFHVANPVPSTTSQNPEVELLEPAVKGTQNVLKACLEAKVSRLVYASSGAAVGLNPNWPKHQAMDETCWSDQEFCRATKNCYCLSKTQAESQAFKFSKKTGLEVVWVCPTLVLGPVLQSNINASTLVLLKLVKEGYEILENKLRSIVDVLDVVQALVMAYEVPEAQGRYICSSYQIQNLDLVAELNRLFPHYNYPKNISESGEKEILLSNEKLGWTYRPLEETSVDSIESYRAVGLLNTQ